MGTREQWASTGAVLSHRGRLVVSGDVLGSQLRVGVLMASRGWRPGMLTPCRAQDAPPLTHPAPAVRDVALASLPFGHSGL